METKSCPNCGTIVPVVAYRCKECFHDLNERPAQRSTKGLVIILATLAAMAIGGSVITNWRLQQPTSIKTLVNGDNRTVQIIREYRGGEVQTDQVTFDQVAKIEYAAGATGAFRITAVTADGRRLDLEVSDSSPLLGKAESHAQQIGKPLEIVDKPSGEAL
jgi:hypothetical protein